MTAEFKRGPWVAGFADGSGPEYILAKSGGAIARVRWGCSCCEDRAPLTSTEAANARLIAASPRLHYLVEAMYEEGHKAKFSREKWLKAAFKLLMEIEGEE